MVPTSEQQDGWSLGLTIGSCWSDRDHCVPTGKQGTLLGWRFRAGATPYKDGHQGQSNNEYSSHIDSHFSMKLRLDKNWSCRKLSHLMHIMGE